MALSVLLYEDNDLLRESIGSMMQLDDRYRVAGAFNNVLTAEKQVVEINPDIVLMDIDMPGRTGIEAVKRIRAMGIRMPVLMLTVFDDTEHVFDAICAGASGYLLKSADPAEIKKAITEVMSKGYYLNNFVNRILLKKSHSRQKVVPTLNSEITLSERERDVIKYICMEFTAHEIAQKLDVSPRTVEAIKDRLMERFGAKNTAGLVFFAVKNNLID